MKGNLDMPKAAKTAEKEKTTDATQDQAPQPESKKQVQTADFPEATESESSNSEGKFDILLDMDVPVTVVLGQTEIPVRRLLQLGQGSVLKLDKPIDAPVDLYLKDARFAQADVVVVDGCFAVRIKNIIGANSASEKQGQ